ncbi:efflux transporter periplasmic adaptor subunit [Candidatus Williamhamiltonella defendens]|nr:efflux RND transporter periplasmic adaptor subunit [Candidatus Hamiltonella defensa]AYB48707.1 efflux transporter periplasmic adaptor subunit [Candidatus Hamiltonella defensa]
MNKNREILTLATVFMLSVSLLMTGCDNNKHPPKHTHPQMPEVGVIILKAQSLNMTSELPGRTSAFRIVEVRPQVNGIILKRHYVEGSDVTEGAPLYEINAATYKAAYDSAQGDLAKAQANAKIARLTLKRYKSLHGKHYISQQDYDQALLSSMRADAEILSAKAALEKATIHLSYTKIIAPMSGRSGKSSVTEGALVTDAQINPLTTIQQIDPMYVNLTQSSGDFLRLQQELASGQLKHENGKTKVKLLLESGIEYPEIGTLEFSDITVNQTTGSITIRAVFPNPHKLLLPGMFVRARLEEGIKSDALLVPQQGVTRDPEGQATAMVVDKNDKVELRKLKTAQAIGHQWLVTSGLQPGDRVIVTGLQKIAQGMQVKVQEES